LVELQLLKDWGRVDAHIWNLLENELPVRREEYEFEGKSSL